MYVVIGSLPVSRFCMFVIKFDITAGCKRWRTSVKSTCCDCVTSDKPGSIPVI